jgi:tetratricopeptide (TPR) repeat protein
MKPADTSLASAGVANRGRTVKRASSRHEEVLAKHDRALALDPGSAQSHFNRGNALRALKRHKEALACYERALAIRPGHAGALYNRGNALRDLKRYEQALDSYNRALDIQPAHAAALNNRGIVLRALRRHEESLASYDRALALKPDDVGTLNNRGNVLLALKRHDEALASFQRALALKPDHAGAHWNEGLCRLITGDFGSGWRKYEWRWQRATFTSSKRDFSEPLWLGDQPVAGKTVLLHAEQGFGDTIQFCRYASVVAALGAKVVLEAQPPLRALLASLDGPAQVVAKGEALPAFDYHCPLLSLPLAFDTRIDTVPSSIPYLRAPVDRVPRWAARLGTSAAPRVGIAWSGQPKHRNDHNRSIALASLLPLLGKGVQFVGLQKDVRSRDREILDRHRDLLNLGEELTDFADTAALISQLDLVIAVDTSVAHLAGALGKPVWVLLPFTPDWRWLLDRDDSPWYPTARLFRQPASGDWDSVVRKVVEALGDKFGITAAPR